MSDSDTEVLPGLTEEPPDNADLPGELRAAAPRKWWNRATPLLLGVFLLAGGFLGGVQVQKHYGRSPSPAASAVTRQMPGGVGFSGPPGGGGFGMGGTNATTGTLKSVTATALTVQTAAGRTVTVKIAESTKIQQTTTLAELAAGRSVTVQGATATDGSITATAVTAS